MMILISRDLDDCIHRSPSSSTRAQAPDFLQKSGPRVRPENLGELSMSMYD